MHSCTSSGFEPQYNAERKTQNKIRKKAGSQEPTKGDSRAVSSQNREFTWDWAWACFHSATHGFWGKQILG